MFDKILIANRGEIACRVVRTARAMGIRTVAVFSDADASALHVREADEAVRIGPSPAAESYLKIDALVAAAKATGAQAVHPGYGFLSENPAFAEALATAGIVFIGPTPSAIRAMGLKDAAKKLMEQAGVPVVPGYHGERQEPAFLAKEAERVGYPVLIKARAGGGGKGMRRVDDPAQFAAALESAQREGQASFGDGRVLVEKYLAKPRHIEIQVLGDSHGNVIHLNERDCSLQRRHQKVIEEAPAPGMSAEMRAAMGSAAVKAAEAIGYTGAGTIEFIVDGSEGLRSDRFYFMEMNTRLQVEHPVTEAITGLDLVAEQIRVAAGERLSRTQDQVGIDGWAVEARLYAEDAARGFLPAVGTVRELRFPAGVRVDSGVTTGDAITPYYDPMIAKIIAHGPSRRVALQRLAHALEDTVVEGTTTNRAFLAALCREPSFVAGDVDTGLIERTLADLTREPEPDRSLTAVAGLLLGGFLDDRSKARDPFDALAGFANWGTRPSFVDVETSGATVRLAITPAGRDRWTVSDDDGALDLRVMRTGTGSVAVEADGAVRNIHVTASAERVTLFAGSHEQAFCLAATSAGTDAADASGDQIVAPMPGLVKIVKAAAGDVVARGGPVIVMEAMKMELTLAAPRDGTVAEMLVAVGDQVVEGAVLAVLRTEAEGAAS